MKNRLLQRTLLMIGGVLALSTACQPKPASQQQTPSSMESAKPCQKNNSSPVETKVCPTSCEKPDCQTPACPKPCDPPQACKKKCDEPCSSTKRSCDGDSCASEAMNEENGEQESLSSTEPKVQEEAIVVSALESPEEASSNADDSTVSSSELE